jgi:hypothetical protein
MRRENSDRIYSRSPRDGSTFTMAASGWKVSCFFLVALLLVQCYGNDDDPGVSPRSSYSDDGEMDDQMAERMLG